MQAAATSALISLHRCCQQLCCCWGLAALHPSVCPVCWLDEARCLRCMQAVTTSALMSQHTHCQLSGACWAASSMPEQDLVCPSNIQSFVSSLIAIVEVHDISRGQFSLGSDKPA